MIILIGIICSLMCLCLYGLIINFKLKHNKKFQHQYYIFEGINGIGKTTAILSYYTQLVKQNKRNRFCNKILVNTEPYNYNVLNYKDIISLIRKQIAKILRKDRWKSNSFRECLFRLDRFLSNIWCYYYLKRDCLILQDRSYISGYIYRHYYKKKKVDGLDFCIYKNATYILFTNQVINCDVSILPYYELVNRIIERDNLYLTKQEILTKVQELYNLDKLFMSVFLQLNCIGLIYNVSKLKPSKLAEIPVMIERKFNE